MSDSQSPYDLRDPEAMFHCIDVLTRARSVLSGTDPHLAKEIGRLTEALMGLIDPDTMEIGAAPASAPPSQGPVRQPDSRQFDGPPTRQPMTSPRQGPPTAQSDFRQPRQPVERAASPDWQRQPPPSHGAPETARKPDRFADFDPADLLSGSPMRRSRHLRVNPEPEQAQENESNEIVDVLTGEKIKLRDKK